MNGLTQPQKYKAVSKLAVGQPDFEIYRNLFFRYLRLMGSYTEAADALGIPPYQILALQKSDKEFADGMENALLETKADLESIAYKMAKSGDRQMLQFMLKRLDPAYRDSYQPPAEDNRIQIVKTYINISPDMWDNPAPSLPAPLNQIEGTVVGETVVTEVSDVVSIEENEGEK